MRDQLVFLQVQVRQILGAMDRAPELNDAGLAAIAACTRANIEQEAANLGKGLGALGTLLGILDIFMAMIGGPKAPDLSAISGKPLDEAVKPLDDLIVAPAATAQRDPGALMAPALLPHNLLIPFRRDRKRDFAVGSGRGAPRLEGAPGPADRGCNATLLR